jgi:phospholipid/cholesterol/gamma-HCH transport system ATP-binding protein
VISVRSLGVRIGGRELLRDVSTTLARGEILGVIGPAEAGKTLFLKALAGLVPVTAGEIWVDDLRVDDLDDMGRATWQRRIGMAFQNDALFDALSVFDNVAFPLRRRQVEEAEVRGRVEARLEEVGLLDAADKLPGDLSGGMRKRVGIARATVTGPEIALFDEPVSGLDPVSAARIFELVVGLSQSLKTATVVVSSDLPALLPVANRVLVLHGGENLYDGPVDGLSQAARSEVVRFVSGRDGEPPDV